jgi:hypothetical protein
MAAFFLFRRIGVKSAQRRMVAARLMVTSSSVVGYLGAGVVI